MRLNDILVLTGASKKSIYRWMDAHPTIATPDPDSLLGHAFPRPIDQAGRAMVWDEDAVSAWWRENAGTVGRHPVLGYLDHETGHLTANEVLELANISRATLTRWMDHEWATQRGFTTPFPVGKMRDGKTKLWDRSTVEDWLNENEQRLGRHPKHNATPIHSRYIHPEHTTGGGFMENKEGMGSSSSDMVQSESNQRTTNNSVRHQYRVLTEAEKASMVAIKDKGQEFLDLLDGLEQGRETALAKTKIEEAVMWAVKGLTK